MMPSNKILFVEDEFTLLKGISASLGVYSDITGVASLAEAQKALVNETFDLVLLDKGLPDGSGLDLLPRIREVSPDTAVIILTGDSDFNSVNKCIAAGADDYLVKSEFIMQDLLVRIPLALKKARLRKEIEALRKHLSLILPTTVEQLTSDAYEQFLSMAERGYLERVLDLCGGDPNEAADRIGIARSTISYKMGRLGILRRPKIKTNFVEPKNSEPKPHSHSEKENPIGGRT